MRRFLFASVIGALALCGCGGGAGGGGPVQPATPLSPARTIAGTWKDFVPVTVDFATNFCGPMQLAASQPWTITFVITPGSSSNNVNVQMNMSEGSFSTINQCAAGGIAPEPSPMFLTGTISSSNLVLWNGNTQVGNFNFTSSIMTGTFNYTWTQAYTQQEYTANSAISLTLQ